MSIKLALVMSKSDANYGATSFNQRCEARNPSTAGRATHKKAFVGFIAVVNTSLKRSMRSKAT